MKKKNLSESAKVIKVMESATSSLKVNEDYSAFSSFGPIAKAIDNLAGYSNVMSRQLTPITEKSDWTQLYNAYSSFNNTISALETTVKFIKACLPEIKKSLDKMK